ncbi:hypothetical protein ACFSL4_17420 [Streptomyces caeni]|uniref:Uncharacterized protein n=1 Tax=Streptomyces caeni TaxID=2307231 RepID=A0ABW4ISI1_9ACTN
MSDTTAPAAGGSSSRSRDRARPLPSSPFGITVGEKTTDSPPVSFAPITGSVVPIRLAAV